MAIIESLMERQIETKIEHEMAQGVGRAFVMQGPRGLSNVNRPGRCIVPKGKTEM